MIGLWVSGFCAAAAFLDALEQKWGWAAVLGILAVLNFQSGRDSIRQGR